MTRDISTVSTEAPGAAHVPLSQVETDAFCDCGYNLHGQPVWRDPQLDLLVCRCPECGRHAAAGRFTGIHSAWLHRASTAVLLLWILFLLGTFLFLAIMLGVWPSVHADIYTNYAPIPNQGPSPTQYWMDFRELNPATAYGINQMIAFFIAMAALNGAIAGFVAAACLWHLRRGALLLLLLPILANAVSYYFWTTNRMSPLLQEWLLLRMALYTVLEIAGVAAGLLAGRTVARSLLRLLLPQRLLQHFAFLWYRDGRELPLLSPRP